jgi:hypothetical protein
MGLTVHQSQTVRAYSIYYAPSDLVDAMRLLQALQGFGMHATLGLQAATSTTSRAPIRH